MSAAASLGVRAAPTPVRMSPGGELGKRGRAPWRSKRTSSGNRLSRVRTLERGQALAPQLGAEDIPAVLGRAGPPAGPSECSAGEWRSHGPAPPSSAPSRDVCSRRSGWTLFLATLQAGSIDCQRTTRCFGSTCEKPRTSAWYVVCCKFESSAPSLSHFFCRRNAVPRGAGDGWQTGHNTKMCARL